MIMLPQLILCPCFRTKRVASSLLAMAFGVSLNYAANQVSRRSK